MSDQDTKNKHSKRIAKTERHIERQVSIAKAHGFPNKIRHMFHKLTSTTCGNADCVMCGNPRKFFKEKTIQERRNDQRDKYNKDTEI
jgi:hypothetical protein